MDCVRFAEIVHDLERPGTEGHALHKSALAHAELCERCGALLEEVALLDFALDALAASDGDAQAPARLETALLAEFRRRHAEAVQPRKNFHTMALAAAAVVLLAMGISLRYWMPPAGVDVAVAPTVQTTKPAVNTKAGAADENAVTSDENEYATNFVALPYADDPATIEGGTVVRVTLSRAALASMGMPVTGLSAEEAIPADIALSEDGTPQAIRLVADATGDQMN